MGLGARAEEERHTTIESGSDEVDGAAGGLLSGLKNLLVDVGVHTAGELGKERGVDVQEATLPTTE